MSDHQLLAFETGQTNAEDRIHEMLALASRLREKVGGELDDTAIAAVAEATGAPVEYVRLAVRTLPTGSTKRTLIDQCKSAFLGFNPDVRRYVAGGVLGTVGAFMQFLANAAGDTSGFLSMLGLLGVGAGVWNAVVARSPRAAALAGATQGAVSVLAHALFAFVYQWLFFLLSYWHVWAHPVGRTNMMLLPVFALLGAGAGVLAHELAGRNRAKLGLHDPAEERNKLLHQLVEITDKLKSDEQYVTFLSVDIVGSTQLKVEADPLSVEFTFNEYHRFVEQVVSRHGGRVHSTAGDGVTCVFDNPAQGLGAGKAILGGLFEFNAFRNRIGQEIQLRAGVHTGTVLAPGRDATTVNFARVIDVAAHMQKAAPVGGMVVSAETGRMCPGGLNAVGPDRIEVEGIEAATWRPAQHRVPVFQVASAN